MKKLFFLFCLSISGWSVSAQCSLVGGTNLGGNDVGTIFVLPTGDSIFSQIYALDCVSGANAQYNKLSPGPNGKLYGMLSSEGLNGYGVIFEYDTLTHVYTKKVDLPASGYSALCLAGNGKFYGVSPYGGSGSNGVLFEYDPNSNVYTEKKYFWSASTDGLNPFGSLIEAANGKLYGMTQGGGVNGKGAVFEYDYVNDVMTKRFDFAGTANGSTPYGSLIDGGNTKLYGMTSAGGTGNVGVIFEFDPGTYALNKKFDFAGLATGSAPYGDLFKASNGLLYGLTTGGGVNGKGVLFEYDYQNTIFTKRVDLSDTLTGSKPYGSLTAGSNGKLYASTSQGGVLGFGTLLEYDITMDTCGKIWDFDKVNGSTPKGSLLSAGNILYGCTFVGGSAGRGVLFEYAINNNQFTKRVDLFASEAANFKAPLFEASNGKFYGMTTFGGPENFGVLYEYNLAANIFTPKQNFDDTVYGRYPNSSLVEIGGKLYGTTSRGGANNWGTLFEYDPVMDTMIKKFDFSFALGGSPGTLVKASNGRYFGPFGAGGTSGHGGIYEYDPVMDTVIYRYQCVSTLDGVGIYPLLAASNGMMYGVATSGGTGNYGVIFEYDPNTYTYTKTHDFDFFSGGNPVGALIEAYPGKLYGLAAGGFNQKGVVFEYDIAGPVYKDKYDFLYGNTYDPQGALLMASDGKMYGVTSLAGTYFKGTVFSYDTIPNSIDFIASFDGTNGKGPIAGLIETCQQTTATNLPDGAADMRAFPNPTSGLLIIEGAPDGEMTMMNVLGKIVKQQRAHHTSMKLDISDLPGGIYFVTVNTTRGIISKKIVVQH